MASSPTVPESAAHQAAEDHADLLVVTVSNGRNLVLARRCVEIARQRGLRVRLLDLSDDPLPLFTSQRFAQDGIPAAAIGLKQQLIAAERWLICSPEYNGSIPPVLTNAIAWLSVQGEDFRGVFNERPIALASHSGGSGTTMLAALRLQLAHLGAHVVGRQALERGEESLASSSLDDLLRRLLTLH
ncbi:MAG: NADPH-dependent FMN reductase [Synechococcaceae cyanobacterium]|jgi:chromate reductase